MRARSPASASPPLFGLHRGVIAPGAMAIEGIARHHVGRPGIHPAPNASALDETSAHPTADPSEESPNSPSRGSRRRPGGRCPGGRSARKRDP